MFHCDSLHLCSFSLTDFGGFCDCTYRVLLQKEGLLTNQSYIKLQRSVKSLLGYPWFNSTNAPFESYMMGGTGVGYVLLRMLNDDLNSALL